jgi:hypothetical protein
LAVQRHAPRYEGADRRARRCSDFRVNPAGVSILCGAVFKDVVERSGLTGVKLEEADEIALV